ncbi:MAG: DUF29 domain-containing protein [Acetobacteraceae bacterium]|nr:DUF29 domain-containing protein [Acetobacteraceae bacterium]
MGEYETDILQWSEHQAALLRRLAAGQAPNEQPDWPNIIEEVESVGGSELARVRSLLIQALVHMLKAEAWPQSPGAPGWRNDARLFRVQASDGFAPSMRQRTAVSNLYAKALKALPDTIDGQPPLPVPAQCSLTLDELLLNDP